MHILNLLKEASSFLRQAEQADVIVFTYIPSKAIKSIRDKGLLSARELIKDKAALALARPNSRKEFIKNIEEKIDDPEWEDIVSGISVFFSLPDFDKIDDKHHIFKNNLVPIAINLSKLKKDHPETKIIGVELLPSLSKNRERELSIKEVAELTAKTPHQLWKHYKNPGNKMYAPNVPHAVIVPPKYKIPSAYIIS